MLTHNVTALGSPLPHHQLLISQIMVYLITRFKTASHRGLTFISLMTDVLNILSCAASHPLVYLLCRNIYLSLGLFKNVGSFLVIELKIFLHVSGYYTLTRAMY